MIYLESSVANLDMDRANLYKIYLHLVFTISSVLPSIDNLPRLPYTLDTEFTEMEGY